MPLVTLQQQTSLDRPVAVAGQGREVFMEERKVEEFRRACSSVPLIRFAYLFGARVNGHCSGLSTFGLAVYLGKHAPFASRLRLMQRLALALRSHDFDLVVLDDAPLSTNREIVRYGRVIKEESGLRESFETRLAQIAGHLEGVAHFHAEAFPVGGEENVSSLPAAAKGY